MFNRKNTTTSSTPRRKPPQRSSIDYSALRKAGRVIDNAGSGFIRWMITDHSGGLDRASLILGEPSGGFLAHVLYAIKWFLITVGWALGRVLLIVILYIIWIPIVLWFLYYVLTH